MMCNNPNVDLVNMNAYIKFGEILSICSQDIERKRNFYVDQGPKLWYRCAKQCLFVLLLYVMAGWSVHLTTLFPGQA